jgi:hypothetical protein
MLPLPVTFCSAQVGVILVPDSYSSRIHTPTPLSFGPYVCFTPLCALLLPIVGGGSLAGSARMSSERVAIERSPLHYLTYSIVTGAFSIDCRMCRSILKLKT